MCGGAEWEGPLSSRDFPFDLRSERRLSPPMTCPFATMETPQGSRHPDPLGPGQLLRRTAPRLLGPGRTLL